MNEVILLVSLVVMSLTATTFAILWYRATKTRPYRENTLRSRIRKIPREQLPQWADQLMGETGRLFSAWRGSHDPAFLQDCLVGAEGLRAVFEEIESRTY